MQIASTAPAVQRDRKGPTDLPKVPSDLGILARALELRDTMSPEERQMVDALPYERRTFQRNQDIVADHSKPNASCVVLNGYAARAVYLESGKRQLTAIHIPGDFVDLHAFLLKRMDHGVIALTDCEVAFIPHAKLASLTERAPHLTRLLWLSTIVDAAIGRTWLACIGRRSPSQHIAHLLCELSIRLSALNLASGNQFAFPVTQSDLADMLGLSIVHVNKTLAQERARGLFAWNGSMVKILDFTKLAKFADFDPVYLSLMKTPR